ncbi:hypothetical protein QBC37DRAFT_486321 [Rhypophila decipiens]|uniref:FAD/NAD(P)-binding domain-containing protein n=1 Tax=Rhypophila decipiens TaxID=261697 RepID=A0AAN6XYU4_9PEZI|nr:hypothetical protein QBC37DRAFT_486321 [Rhypophila decipiens]
MALSSSPASSEFLNAQNKKADKDIVQSDIVVVGGGIHSLIYSIHALKRLNLNSCLQSPSITVLEKSHSPGYKIGESTLTTFGLWLKTVGIGSALLWRLFGPKDGLAFYYLNPEDPDDIGTFSANGPSGDFVPTLQIERSVSELLLTLYAQRLGVTVLHGHSVDIDATAASLFDPSKTVDVKVTTEKQRGISTSIEAKLLVDATGRFRRLASKTSPRTRFPGFNTDSFWAYFEFDSSFDERNLPFPCYESCNTNHICLPEGWAWIIRLPSWEGSPLPNLVKMINFLLDLNAKNAHPDDYPPATELARRFDLKFRWVVSIGYALRSDVIYPPDADLQKYGTCEAERKFNWITSRYERMTALMSRHKLIHDLYGPKTTWFTRKTLTYDSPVVAGHNWAAIGDAAGFTNPLYSPGINCNMATSVYLAELTPRCLAGQGKGAMDEYATFCKGRVENLHRMNVFNYLLMRSPRTGPLGPLWQYLCGTGNRTWQTMRHCTFEEVARTIMAWEWGSDREEYIAFAKEAIKLLEGPACLAPDEVVEKVVQLSEIRLRQAVETGKYKSRWAGLLRWYDDELVRREEKPGRDVLARRCETCGNWRILRDDVRRCATCGAVNEQTAIVRYN